MERGQVFIPSRFSTVAAGFFRGQYSKGGGRSAFAGIGGGGAGAAAAQATRNHALYFNLETTKVLVVGGGMGRLHTGAISHGFFNSEL